MVGLCVTCAACKASFLSSDTVISTNCGHIFHIGCLLQWKYRANYCPVCRTVNPSSRRIYLNFENNHEFENAVDNLKAKLNDKNREILKLNDKNKIKIDDMNRLYNISEQWRSKLQMQIHKQSHELQIQKDIHCKEMNLKLDEIQSLRLYIEQLEKGNVVQMFTETINKLSAENLKLAKHVKDTEELVMGLNHRIEIQEKRFNYIIKDESNADINQAKIAANRICKALKVSQDNERLIEEYERLASDLLDWIRRTMAWLNDYENYSLAGVQKKLQEYQTYRRKQKPPRVEQKASLEINFNKLQTKLRQTNSPAYFPTEGKNFDISNAWQDLVLAEKELEWVLAETMCLERLEHLAKNFNKLSDVLGNWTCEQGFMFKHATFLQLPDFRQQVLNELKVLRKKQEILQSEFAAHRDHIKQISSIAQELNTLKYHACISVKVRCTRICDQWNHLGALIQSRDTALEGAERIIDEIDSLFHRIEKHVPNMAEWFEAGRNKDIGIMFAMRTSADIQVCFETYDEFRATLAEVNTDFNLIVNIMRRESIVKQHHLASGGIGKENATLSVSEIKRKWNVFCQLVTHCDQNLTKETVNNNINEVENQILTRDSKGISQEQLNEFRSSFNHFDKNRTGRLTPEEFKSCLVSLGYSIGKDRQGEMDFQRILAVVDPNSTGYVHCDAFLDFMTRESTDTDTAEQVIDSFRILAADKPYILPEELRRELPPDQAEYCIQRMPPYMGPDGIPGALDYMSFSTALYGEPDLSA